MKIRDLPPECNPHLKTLLSRAQALCGFAFVITDSYRPGDLLAHGDGDAVDIACDASSNRFLIVSALIKAGFKRIGVYPRHVHADLSVRLPFPVLFIGEYDA